jgi:hypothetical protein
MARQARPVGLFLSTWESAAEHPRNKAPTAREILCTAKYRPFTIDKSSAN